MKKIAFAAVAASALIATPAFAQDSDTDMSGFNIAAVTGLDTTSLEDSVDTERDTGLLYGLTVGYDSDFGDAIVGLEAEVSDTTITSEVGGEGTDIYAGIRVGMKIDSDGLIYAKAGYTNLNVDGFDNLDGARVGVGYQRSFSDNFFGRLEYRYSTYDFEDQGPDINGNRNQVVLTIGARF